MVVKVESVIKADVPFDSPTYPPMINDSMIND